MTLIAECRLDHVVLWSPEMLMPEQIPAMQRRRLSTVAKKALAVACQSLAQAHAANTAIDYIIWLSRFGDEAKTLGILQDIDTGDTPSPTAFSTSVHNAIAGLYSILLKDDTPSTSLSSGEESLSQGLLEALALLRSGQAKRVLLVYYDEPLPALYQATFTSVAGYQSCAVTFAAVMSLDHPNLRLSGVELQLQASTQEKSQEALVFQSFWQSAQQSLQHGRYVWEKQ
jgi:3-oxoacyl-(acyl-carrier-protein) synthase